MSDNDWLRRQVSDAAREAERLDQAYHAVIRREIEASSDRSQAKPLVAGSEQSAHERSRG